MFFNDVTMYNQNQDTEYMKEIEPAVIALCSQQILGHPVIIQLLSLHIKLQSLWSRAKATGQHLELHVYGREETNLYAMRSICKLYLFDATYTLPNVPRPISFPFCHWPLIGVSSALGETGGIAVGCCDGVTLKGGSGSGWTLP